LEHAEELALRGVFINQGQNCLAAERIYVHRYVLGAGSANSKIVVLHQRQHTHTHTHTHMCLVLHRSVYAKFCEGITTRVKKLRQGCPCTTTVPKQGETLDCGAITMPRQLEIVEELVQDAIQNGAKLCAGGTRVQGTNGLFFAPTLLTDVNHTMRVVLEEAFGPIMLVIPFDSDEEVIRYANSTQYGLGCSIFSTDYARAESIGKKIVSGMLTINDFGLSYLIQAVPFGGVKVSFSPLSLSLSLSLSLCECVVARLLMCTLVDRSLALVASMVLRVCANSAAKRP
jgi:acyl-CoA reductase-like NAD-dependent aldehyde dehydrogenase